MIEEPFQSILNRDLGKLHRFVLSAPREKWGMSESGRTPLQLAYHKNSAILGVVIVATAPESISEVDWTYDQLIKEVIEEYSEESLCAGWYQNIEYILWAVINRQYTFDDNDRLDWLPDEIKECILRAAKLGDTWATWPDDEDAIKNVDIEAWIEMYEAWKKTKS